MSEIGIYVLDSLERRAWGPFYNIDDADSFIEKDKYLQSWCTITWALQSNISVYSPKEYF
jgi:hypothetical protein